MVTIRQKKSIIYILNINLQLSFIMVKVLGELKALVIKGEDCLKEGQHLQGKHMRRRKRPEIKGQQVKEKPANYIHIMTGYDGIV